jgi:putative toxin-antitoxin system antitoxin component (TIGR02293 family)
MATETIQYYVPSQHKALNLWQQVGFPASHGPLLLQALEDGLSVTVVDKLARQFNLTKATLFELTGINPRSFNRRKNDGKFSSKESERLARFVRVVDTATKLMGGDHVKAIQWLNEPAMGLGGKTPFSLIKTETGGLEVMSLIGRIRNGVFV